MKTTAILKQNLIANLALAMGLIIVIANLASNKLTSVFGMPIDCGFLFFPLTYLIADIANERLGVAQAKVLVWYGFISSFAVTSGIFFIKMMPEYYGWENQEALDKFFSLSFRISIASLSSYIIGMYLNVHIFAYLKTKYAKLGVIMRFFLSTMVGACIENTLFYIIAFLGLMSINELFVMLTIQYGVKLIYNLFFSVIVAHFLRRKTKESEVTVG